MNRFIMANSQQCLGCHACEIACVMAHNDEQHVLSQHHFHPRITVIKHQQQRSAVTCHHCEDAPCARSCPNGAISHVDDSIQVNQQKCIGCKSCVVACPFGTMQIVLTPVAAGKVKATAHKCDLCAGRENGPACVENCPADALQLVTDVALSGMAKSRRLRTARQEHQPWHASTAAQEMPVMSKVEQMQATPARGEPDKLAIEARKTGFDEIYLYAEDPTLTKEEYDNYHSFVRLRQGTEEKVLSVCPRLASGMMSTITKIDFANTAAFQPV